MPDEAESRPRPLEYADPELPKGTTFHQFQYPSDCAGFFNPARVSCEGNVLKLEPGHVVLRITLMYILLAAYVAWSSYRPIHHRFEIPFVPLIIATIFVMYIFRSARKRDLDPWIAIDHEAKEVYLPRASKTIRFTDVVRLQVVSFTSEGISRNYLSYRSGAPPSELQIVFNNGAREETSCVVAWPDERILNEFLRKLREFTGVPVSRVRRLTSGEWSVAPFER